MAELEEEGTITSVPLGTGKPEEMAYPQEEWVREGEEAEPEVDPFLTAEREEELPAVSTRKPSSIASFGGLVAGALGMPDKAAEIEAGYEATGRSKEWESRKLAWAYAKDEALREEIVTSAASATFGEPEEVLRKAAVQAAVPEVTAYAENLGRAYEAVGERPFYSTLEEALDATYQEKQDVVNEANNVLASLISPDFDKWDIIGGLLVESLPFVETATNIAVLNPVIEKWKDRMPESVLVSDSYKKDATNIAVDPASGNIFPGESAQAMKAIFVQGTRDQKFEIIRDIAKEINDSTFPFTDLGALSVFDSVVNEATLQRGDPNELLWRLVSNGVFMLETTAFGAATATAIKLGLKLRAAAPLLKAMNNFNKDASGTAMARIFATPDEDATNIAREGMSQADIGRTQVPGLEAITPSISDQPDSILRKSEWFKKVDENIDTTIDRMRNAVLTPEQKQLAIDTQRDILEKATWGTIRPGLSRVEAIPHSDGAGVRFKVVLGSDDENGFKTQSAAYTHFLEIDKLKKGARLLRSNGTKLVPNLKSPIEPEAKEVMKHNLAEMKAGRMYDEPSNYFIEWDEDYYFRPEDRALFGDEPFIGSTWAGSGTNWLGNPSSTFSPEYFGIFEHNYLREQFLIRALNNIIAPITRLSKPTQRAISDIYIWNNDFYIKNGKAPSPEDLKEAFPDLPADALNGFSLLKAYYGKIYQIQNDRLYRDWHGRGFKTLRNAVTKEELHGKPQTMQELARDFENGSVTVYDPTTKAMKELTVADVKQLYKHNGAILRAELKLTVDDKTYATLIMKDPLHTDWDYAPLSKYVLKNEEGYWPRQYEDPYYIEKFVPDAKINGRVGQEVHIINGQRVVGVKHVIKVAHTRKAAEEEVGKLIARAREKGENENYRVGNDARLSDRDRTARDLEYLQTEGRLFFDDRQPEKLRNTWDNPADIINPINMIQRTSRMVARQLATEDLTKSYKVAFNKFYGDIIQGDIENLPAGAISAELKQIIQRGSPEERAKAIKASEFWDYIRLMDGNIEEGPKRFRRVAIYAAEKLGELTTGSRPTAAHMWVYRNIHKASPVESLKSLAFFDYITTRPFRQILLQGSQHLMLSGIDPVYHASGKWYRDSFGLMQGRYSRAIELSAGPKVRKQMRERNAKLMGLSLDEYDTLVREYDQSGLVAAINVHGFYGDNSKVTDIADTKLGDAMQTAGRTLTFAPVREAMQKWGFDLGESFVQTSTYNMALRQFMKEKFPKGTKLTKLTKDDWQQVAKKSADLAMAMHRPNASKFQYGPVSVLTQFLSFTHKVFLSMLAGATGGKFGNKQLSPSNARRMLVGQIVYFGAAGFGMQTAVEKLLEETGLGAYIGTPASDLLAGGFLDMGMDTALSQATGSDTDFAFGRTLAPGGNMVETAVNFAEMALTKPLVETLTDMPSGSTLGRLWENYHLARDWVDISDDEDTIDSWKDSFDLIMSGFMSGYNDIFMAHQASRHGRWLSKNGELSYSQAALDEAIAKGAFGLRAEGARDGYEITMEQKELTDSLDQAAREYYNRLNKLVVMFGDGKVGPIEYKYILRQEKNLIKRMDKEHKLYLMEKFTDLALAARKGDNIQDSILDNLARATEAGLPPGPWIMKQLDGLGLPKEDLEVFKIMVDRAVAEHSTIAEIKERNINSDLKSLEEQEDAN